MGGGVIRMNEKKPMPDDHSWFWHEGFKDAIAGRRRDAPDPIGSLPRSWQLADYFEGYEAGEEERFPPEQNYLCRKCGWTADADDASFFGIPEKHTRCPVCNGRLSMYSLPAMVD